MKLLLDTSVIIDFQRAKQKQNTWLYQLANQGLELYISVITQTELYAGSGIWEDKKKKKELEIVLSNLTVLSLNSEISQMSGKVRHESGIKITDAIIAATAITNNLSLATFDKKDFPKVKKLKLVKKPS
ncbi:MAG TPA: PIN domain-containing protein [Patescibacteria group bacterium]|nr:PIN domain-containing protein [Patescibacteria group bacterium]